MKNKFFLAKWWAGEMTERELDAFEKLPEFKTYTKIKSISSQIKVSDFDTETMYQNIVQSKKNEKPTSKLTRNWFMKIAAILVLALGMTFLFKMYNVTNEYTLAGTKNSFLLPDNSQVVLNSGSEIDYKKWNWKKNRILNLKGEAYFKAEKGDRFEVNTDLGKVTVIGTAFNVKSRNTTFEVECYEGKVEVSFNEEIIVLTQNQNVAFRDGKKIPSIPLNDENPAWMRDEIKINSGSLDEILKELERCYNITIESKQISNNRKFTGTLPMNNLDTALQIVSKAYDLRYNTVSDKKVVLTLNDNIP